MRSRSAAALLILLESTGTLATALAGGATTGNGGDAVHCAPSPDNSFAGYYSLDYVLENLTDAAISDVAPAPTWEESGNRILELLLSKEGRHQPIRPALAEFIKRSAPDAPTGQTSQRLWKKAPFGLIPLADEEMAAKLPPNCVSSIDSQGRPLVIQAVIRERVGRTTVYHYDPAVLAQLRTPGNDLQFSYLMIHEALWDIVENAKVNRSLNQLLHSRALESMTPQALADALRALHSYECKAWQRGAVSPYGQTCQDAILAFDIESTGFSLEHAWQGLQYMPLHLGSIFNRITPLPSTGGRLNCAVNEIVSAHHAEQEGVCRAIRPIRR